MDEIYEFLAQWLKEHDLHPGPVGLVEIDSLLKLAYTKGEIAGMAYAMKKLS